MNRYPAVVATIVSDYMERVKLQLRLAPVREQNEFLAEIESHVYEAYQASERTQGGDEVARILAVLRNLGEPAEVVSDRLPGAMARSGAKRNLPLYILGGILIALFGMPLGLGGLGVLVGILAAIGGVLVAFYAAAGSFLLVGGVFALLGLIRALFPRLLDGLIMLDVVRIDAPTAEFLNHFSTFGQGLLMMLFGAFWLACGFGMVRIGKYLFRGLRFLVVLLFDRMRRLTRGARAKLRPETRDVPPVAAGDRLKTAL
jgi:uncharacterized membrane protein